MGGSRGLRGLMAVMLLAGCAGTSSPAVPESPVEPVSRDVRPTEEALKGYWVPGERMMWNLSFRAMPVARAMLAVGQPGELAGVRTLIVKSRIESMGVVRAISEAHLEMQTWIDLVAHRPIRLEFSAEGTDPRRTKPHRAWGHIEFGAGRLKRTLLREGKAPKTRTTRLPKGARTHDLHTLLAVFRGWTAREGEHAEIVHYDDTRLRSHVVRLTRYELFKSETLGTIPSARIDGLVSRRRGAKGKPYTVWISNDARRLPLRMEVPTKHGRVRLDLVEYDDPRSHKP